MNQSDEQIVSRLLSCFSKNLPELNPTLIIHKDQCVLSMETTFSNHGLFLNLETFECYSNKFLKESFHRTRNRIYLNIKQRTKNSSKQEQSNLTSIQEIQSANRISTTPTGGLGLDLSSDGFEFFYELYIHPEDFYVPLNSKLIPPDLSIFIDKIINYNSSNIPNNFSMWEEPIKESKYSKNLIDASNGKVISNCIKDLRCEKCGGTDNLWLNLSDGYIGCGRKIHFVGGGCFDGKEEGAAILHYYETDRKYPLVVKIGTINSFSADIYSYAEDENEKVSDSNLKEHLMRFKINLNNLEKTERTTSEIEISRNLQHDWSVVTEENEQLEKLYGKNCVGIENLGNTCYMNSVFQLLAGLPEFSEKFSHHFQDIVKSYTFSKFSNDFMVQFAKMCETMNTFPDYLLEQAENERSSEYYLCPRMLISIISKDHKEFSTSRQQDTEEFLSYFLDLLKNAENNLEYRLLQHNIELNLREVHNIFRFKVEHKIQCCQSKQIKRMYTNTHILSLDIKDDLAENYQQISSLNEMRKQRSDDEIDDDNFNRDREDGRKNSKESSQCPKVRLTKLLESWGSDEITTDFLSPVTNTVGLALNTNRFLTFPKYLLLHIKKFYADKNWMAAKKDCHILVDEEIDLAQFKSLSNDSETLQEWINETNDREQESQIEMSEGDNLLVTKLTSLGFPQDLAMEACKIVSGDDEAYIDYCVQHLESFDESKRRNIEKNSDKTATDDSSIKNELEFKKETVKQIVDMGFSYDNVSYAYEIIMSNYKKNGSCSLNLIGSSIIEECIQFLLNNVIDERSFSQSNSRVIQSNDGTDSEQNKQQIQLGEDSSENSKYELQGFITHLGKSANCGHYVCHMKHPLHGWVLYNDKKVAKSVNPNMDFGYIYLYRRKDNL